MRLSLKKSLKANEKSGDNRKSPMDDPLRIAPCFPNIESVWRADGKGVVK